MQCVAGGSGWLRAATLLTTLGKPAPTCPCMCRGPGASRLPLRVTLGVLVTRLVLQPALLTALVVAALRLKLFGAPDAMFLLTMLLSNATPTAINMQVCGCVRVRVLGSVGGPLGIAPRAAGQGSVQRGSYRNASGWARTAPHPTPRIPPLTLHPNTPADAVRAVQLRGERDEHHPVLAVPGLRAHPARPHARLPGHHRQQYGAVARCKQAWWWRQLLRVRRRQRLAAAALHIAPRCTLCRVQSRKPCDNL